MAIAVESTVSGEPLAVGRPESERSIAERTRRRVTWRLIPFLFFLYGLAYLDRVNISVAQFGMEKADGDGGLGFGRDVIGFGAGIFFWGYWILEVPSTVCVVRWGARWTLARVLVLWGLCASLCGVIGTPFAASLFGWLPHLSPNAGWVGWLGATDAVSFSNGLADSPKYQFYFLRFMLGFFEGGFFPSVIVYLSQWFRAEDRARAIAGFMAAIPLSSVVGLPLSGLLLGIDWFGLPGWRWIFILQGVAPILAGAAALFLLPDWPTQARWLPADERDWLLAQLAAEQQAKQRSGRGISVRALGAVLMLTAVYFCLGVASYGLSMFMPAILKSQANLSDLGASCVAAAVNIVALATMLVNGWHSDRTAERSWHVAIPLALLGVSVLLISQVNAPVLVILLMVCGVGVCLYAHLPAFWPIPSKFLGPTAAASAIGFINMIGNLGGSIGPIMVGSLSSGDGGFAPALLRLAPWPIAAGVVILAVGYSHRSTDEADQ